MPIHSPHTAAANAAEIEGVIKFRLSHQERSLPMPAGFTELNAWRNLLFDLGFTGQDPYRYGGLGFGNMSARVDGSQFMISGSQTGGIRRLGIEHYVLVTSANTTENHIDSVGPIKPSSESMTHAAAYEACPWIQCVLHVHHPRIWNSAETLGIPTTPAEVAYGTVAMAEEIGRLAKTTRGPIISMKGHTDGLIAIGRSINEAGHALIDILIRTQYGVSSDDTRDDTPASLE